MKSYITLLIMLQVQHKLTNSTKIRQILSNNFKICVELARLMVYDIKEQLIRAENKTGIETLVELSESVSVRSIMDQSRRCRLIRR